MDNKKPLEDETKRLALVVLYMSALVIVLFGLVPLV
ncbi:hypothetical protein MNBD_GAMMA06-1555 [hydrothermal vent metagenome]|uniref:Uncharacterized protein n=1 Tax=hydrothermal vent metagenome TaxID=652676 RepID=A0A3B0WS66_9ZZZZ